MRKSKKTKEEKSDDLRMRYIYRWTDEDGKCYIGLTVNLKARLSQYTRQSKETKPAAPIILAMREKGIESFTFELISETWGQLDTDAAEEFFIKEFKSLVSENGYNVSTGGHSPSFLSMKGKLKKSGQGRGRRYSENSSIYLGVRKRGKAQFCCYVNISAIKSKEKSFKSEIECAEAHDKIVLHVYGPDAIINFPEKREEFLSLDLELFYKNYVESPPKFPKTSNFNGVRRSYNGFKWMVKFVKKKKIPDSLVLGMFDTAEEAAEMADKVMFYYKNDSNYNFPEKIGALNWDELDLFFKERKFKKKSKYKGVYYRDGRWTGTYKQNKVRYYIGSFPTEEEAHEAILKFIKDNNMTPHAPY